MELPGTRNGAMSFFASCFFHESFFPMTLKIITAPLRFFAKIRGDICNSRCIAGGQLASSGVDMAGEP
jgi:hypothetical protein